MSERFKSRTAVVTAAGSAGQVFGAPVAEVLLSHYPWQTVFTIFAVVILATLAALPFLRSPQLASRAELEESLGTVLVRAFKDPSYTLIFLGFFSCGYQLAFITAHFPAFVTELCSPIDAGSMLAGIGITSTSSLGALAIAVIGLFNIMGTLTAGYLGKRYTKKYLLFGIYTGRTIAAAVFILMPISPMWWCGPRSSAASAPMDPTDSASAAPAATRSSPGRSPASVTMPGRRRTASPSPPIPISPRAPTTRTFVS